MPWRMFLALLLRAGRFAARGILTQMSAVSLAVGGMFGGGMESRMEEQRLRRAAFPWKKREVTFALIQSQEEPSES